MPDAKIVVECNLSRSTRARQLEGMFDVPPSQKARIEWDVSIPIDNEKWNVGLIVGPSGSGKTTIAKELFGSERVEKRLEWAAAAVVDDFNSDLSIEDIAAVCSAVGFNTIPAWLRPYSVLSTGERFRAELARRLIECGELILFDEFTSVVDRQVAQIGSHAVQKYCRRNDKQFVAVTCHRDIIDWLQPDWIYEPAEKRYTWRCLQRRPELSCAISPIAYSAWRMFAPYHYLTAELNRAARCFGLFVDGELASFAGILYRPHAKTRNIMGCSRLVTLPDYQGLGLAFILLEAIASIYRAVGKRMRMYPAHPALIRGFDKSPRWAMTKRGGRYAEISGKNRRRYSACEQYFGGRPNAVFEYIGEAIDRTEAERVLSYYG